MKIFRAAASSARSVRKFAVIRGLMTCTALVAAGLTFAPAALGQATVQFLGDLPGGLGDSLFGISADGSVAVGYSYYVAPGGLLQSHAVRWTQATGLQAIFAGGLDYTSAAFAVSADGLTIGGWHALTIIEERAFVWSAAAGEHQLATRSGVEALSADGSVAAGYLAHGSGSVGRAAIWDANGNSTFIDLPGMSNFASRARGISGDGSIVVGWAPFSGTMVRAFRWTAGTGMVNIGSSDPLGPTSDAYAITPDGSVIVGTVGPPSGETGPSQPARWTAAGGWELLGNLPGGSSGIAYAVSADGNTAVGTSSNQAFIWRQGRGMEDLTTVAAAAGWTFGGSSAISANGRIILASGTHVGGPGGPVLISLPCFTATGDTGAAACVGGSATLGVTATGPGPFTYQWRFDTAPIDKIVNPSAGTATLVLSNLAVANAGSYDCVISNACGSIVSNPASLTVFGSLPGDANGDGFVDADDIQMFTETLMLGASPGVAYCASDLNHDGALDATDVSLVVAALLGN